MSRRVTSSRSCPKKLDVLVMGIVEEDPFLNSEDVPFVGEVCPLVEFEYKPF